MMGLFSNQLMKFLGTELAVELQNTYLRTASWGCFSSITAGTIYTTAASPHVSTRCAYAKHPTPVPAGAWLSP